jgi:hypothetical protein
MRVLNSGSILPRQTDAERRDPSWMAARIRALRSGCVTHVLRTAGPRSRVGPVAARFRACYPPSGDRPNSARPRQHPVAARTPQQGGDVLQAKLLKYNIKPVTDMVAHGARDTDAARRTFGLNSSRHIYRVSMQVRAVGNRVTKVDPYAEADGSIWRLISVCVGT